MDQITTIVMAISFFFFLIYLFIYYRHTVRRLEEIVLSSLLCQDFLFVFSRKTVYVYIYFFFFFAFSQTRGTRKLTFLLFSIIERQQERSTNENNVHRDYVSETAKEMAKSFWNVILCVIEAKNAPLFLFYNYTLETTFQIVLIYTLKKVGGLFVQIIRVHVSLFEKNSQCFWPFVNFYQIFVNKTSFVFSSSFWFNKPRVFEKS